MKMLLLIILSLLLTGCSALPAEERAFAVVLAVDRQAGVWKTSARIPTYQSGGEYATVTGEGDTLGQALAGMDAAAPMHLHLSQVRLVVLAEALGQSEDLALALASLAELQDMRMEAAVALTGQDMTTLLEALKPATGSRLSKSLDVLLESRREQGLSPDTTLADVLRAGDRQSPVLTHLTAEDGAPDLRGGWALPLDGSPPVQLSAADMQMLSLILGHSGSLSLTLEKGDAALQDASARIRLEGKYAQVAMTVRVTRSPWTAEEMEAILARRCLELLTRLYAHGCDVLGLGRRAVRTVDDLAAWHALGWPDACRRLRWTVRVGVRSKT